MTRAGHARPLPACRGEARLAGTLSVHIRIRPALLFSDLHRRADLDQLAFTDARAVLRRAIPFPTAFDQFRPERKRAALRRLSRMNRAAVAFEERALLFRRLAEPHLVARPVNIFLFKCPRRHPHEFRGALQVGFGQVDKALLVAAINAPTLARKAKRVQALIVPFFQRCLVLYSSGRVLLSGTKPHGA